MSGGAVRIGFEQEVRFARGAGLAFFTTGLAVVALAVGAADGGSTRFSPQTGSCSGLVSFSLARGTILLRIDGGAAGLR
jgi:hypothetical protein